MTDTTGVSNTTRRPGWIMHVVDWLDRAACHAGSHSAGYMMPLRPAAMDH